MEPYEVWKCRAMEKELLEALKFLDAKEGEYGLSEVEMGERTILRSQT